jgi:hypothetical protein
MDKFKFALLLFICLLCIKTKAQSLSAVTGLVTIPTAFTPKDGEVSAGEIFTNRKYLDYFDGKYDCMTTYINFTYIPFLELNVRINRAIGVKDLPDYTVDRVASVRLRLLTEKEFRPSIVIGIHDFSTEFGGVDAIHYNASYIVFSKSFVVNKLIDNYDLTLGYSANLMEAHYHEYLGIFGGVSCSIKNVKLMLEYDSRKINIGSQLLLFNHLVFTAGLLKFDSFAAGIGYKFVL